MLMRKFANIILLIIKELERMESKSIRALFSRQHDIVVPRLGVFLAGPTPPDGEMQTGWRRKVVDALKADARLTGGMVVVSPEPESGRWGDIDNLQPADEIEAVRDKQMAWELQYLHLCDVTAFWFPTYWSKAAAGPFAANIGPTSRLEFGYFVQECLRNPAKRRFIVGSPADAEGIKWAKKIADTLVANTWNY